MKGHTEKLEKSRVGLHLHEKKIKIFTHDCKTGSTTKNVVGDDYCTAVVAMSVITIRLISIAFSLLLYD
jgi:hypothetical protein